MMEISCSKQSEKFLKRQAPAVRERILNAIRRLPEGDIKKLRGTDKYRLRVGDFRVIFDRNGNAIYIERIYNQGQVYREDIK